MKIMKIFPKFANSIDGAVCEVPTFCEYQVPEARRSANNGFNGLVGQAGTACEIKYSELFEGSAQR